MYKNLGIHWASSIPAFLALACVPFPFLFYKYGPAIRVRCKFAAESEAFMRRLRDQGQQQPKDGQSLETERGEDVEKEEEVESTARADSFREAEEEVEAMEHSAVEEPKFEEIRTPHSQRLLPSYEENPFNIDRVHTRDSFNGSRSRASSVHSTRSRVLSLALTKSHHSWK